MYHPETCYYIFFWQKKPYRFNSHCVTRFTRQNGSRVGFTVQPICETCANPRRDPALLCVVETPADQNMIEATHGYRGLYYVLMGRLTPLEGIGPDALQFDRLLERAGDGQVQEVILATNFTAEGEATAHVIGQALKSRGLVVTRLARGVPAALRSCRTDDS